MKYSNEELQMAVMKYTIRRHEGLWRFYHNTRRIPVKQLKKYAINQHNFESGKVFIKEYSKQSGKSPELIQKEWVDKDFLEFEMSWDEQSHWAYDDKTGKVYRWVLDDQANTWKSKALCGTVAPGTSAQAVLAQLLDGDITVRDEWNSQDKHRVYKDGKLPTVKWCREFDGKSIVALCIVKNKMTYNEIVNVIVNEGGSVDSQGIIHADK